METHVKTLGWFYLILGALGVLGAAFIGLVVAGGGLISGDRTAIYITTLVAILVGGFLVLVSAPGIIAGIGLLRFRPWARVLALILGIMNIPGFPVGTLLGIYTLWALMDAETDRMFASAG